MPDRYPKVYNTNATSCTLNAVFMAGGVNQVGNLKQSAITWSQSVQLGGTFTLTPSADYRSCTVQANQQGYCQVTVTCTYANLDSKSPSEDITVVFHGQAADQVILTGSS